MANKDVQIGINRSESKEKPEGIAKLQPDARPAQEELLARMRRGSRPKAFGDANGSDPKAVRKYTMAIALLALVLIIAALVIWTGWQAKSKDQANSLGGMDAAGQSGAEVRLTEDIQKSVALELVDVALNITSAQHVDQYFHLGDRPAQEVMDYLQGLELPGKEDRALFWMGNPSYGRNAMVNVAFMWLVEENLDKRLAVLTPDATGEWKIDYGAFACICTPPWSEFLGGKAKAGTARVTFKEDRYFNGRFTDDAWVCYQLTSITSDQPIYGYCKSGSPQHQALEEIRRTTTVNLNDPKSKDDLLRRAMVKLERGEADMPNQFEIKRVLASDWVEEETPYDGRFMAGE